MSLLLNKRVEYTVRGDDLKKVLTKWVGERISEAEKEKLSDLNKRDREIVSY